MMMNRDRRASTKEKIVHLRSIMEAMTTEDCPEMKTGGLQPEACLILFLSLYLFGEFRGKETRSQISLESIHLSRQLTAFMAVRRWNIVIGMNPLRERLISPRHSMDFSWSEVSQWTYWIYEWLASRVLVDVNPVGFNDDRNGWHIRPRCDISSPIRSLLACSSVVNDQITLVELASILSPRDNKVM